jgi:hypothetical protein
MYRKGERAGQVGEKDEEPPAKGQMSVAPTGGRGEISLTRDFVRDRADSVLGRRPADDILGL